MKHTFHATVITGAPAAIEAKAAYLAQSLVCSAGGAEPCGQCRDCRKAAAGIHPDVISVESFMEQKDLGSQIRVGCARDLRADCYIRPNEANRKVYIINYAEKMNEAAQNALLKVVEEGPDYAAFLFLCENPSSLLETIRSRCSVINAGNPEEAFHWEQTALELAQVLAEGGELDKVAAFVRLEGVKRERSDWQRMLESLERLFQDALLGGVTGNFQTPQAQALARRFSPTSLLDRAEDTRKAMEMVRFNVSAGHMLGWLSAKL